MLPALRALRARRAVAVATVPRDIPAEVRAVKDFPAVEEAGGVAKGADPAAQAADLAGRAVAANASISARRKYAGSAWSAWTSSTIRKPRCFSPSSRSAA